MNYYHLKPFATKYNLNQLIINAIFLKYFTYKIDQWIILREQKKSYFKNYNNNKTKNTEAFIK
jgi:hypothetical protein